MLKSAHGTFLWTNEVCQGSRPADGVAAWSQFLVIQFRIYQYFSGVEKTLEVIKQYNGKCRNETLF